MDRQIFHGESTKTFKVNFKRLKIDESMWTLQSILWYHGSVNHRYRETEKHVIETVFLSWRRFRLLPM